MRTLALLVVLASVPAHAQQVVPGDEEPVESEEDIIERERTFEEAPPPGAESGRVDEPIDDDSAGRALGRAVLFVPRGLFEVLMLPIRGGIYLNERFRLSGRIQSYFFIEGGRLGVVPLVFFESSQGVLVGAQFSALLTEDTKFKLFAGLGPSSRRSVDFSLRSKGHLDGRLALTLYGQYDRRPESRFYGIGNANELDDPPPLPMPIDAFAPPFAVETFYRDRLVRAAGVVDLRVADPFWVTLAGLLGERERGDSSRGPEIDMVYEPNTLISFPKYRGEYAEVELRVDTRGPASDWQPRMLLSKGSLLMVFGGRELLEPGPMFWRYGLDAQQFITIGSGPRVVLLRVQGEGITAASDTVPFNELPFLGGRTQLRGYAFERFRDRIAAVGSAEYQWALSRFVYSSLFVDAGRVYSGVGDLTFDDMRCGFGFALEVHSYTSLLARVSIASSIDGGAWFNFYVDPISEVQPRVRRR